MSGFWGNTFQQKALKKCTRPAGRGQRGQPGTGAGSSPGTAAPPLPHGAGRGPGCAAGAMELGQVPLAFSHLPMFPFFDMAHYVASVMALKEQRGERGRLPGTGGARRGGAGAAARNGGGLPAGSGVGCGGTEALQGSAPHPLFFFFSLSLFFFFFVLSAWKYGLRCW